jgi:hypothetical protein
MMRNPTRQLLVAFAASVAILSAGCHTSEEAAARDPEHVIRPADLDALQIGHTTAEEIEQRFGSPDRRDTDGALTYFTKRRASGAQDSVTFRFESGALVKICTTRAA